VTACQHWNYNITSLSDWAIYRRHQWTETVILSKLIMWPFQPVMLSWWQNSSRSYVFAPGAMCNVFLRLKYKWFFFVHACSGACAHVVCMFVSIFFKHFQVVGLVEAQSERHFWLNLLFSRLLFLWSNQRHWSIMSCFYQAQKSWLSLKLLSNWTQPKLYLQKKFWYIVRSIQTIAHVVGFHQNMLLCNKKN